MTHPLKSCHKITVLEHVSHGLSAIAELLVATGLKADMVGSEMTEKGRV